jgi:cytidylate kinase
LIPSLIAIDGPVAVGKSSVGCLLAQRLNYMFFDTGLVYRAFTCKVLEQNVPPQDKEKLAYLAQITEFDFKERENRTFSPIIDGKDVSSEITSSKVEETVYLVSKVSEVRQKMVLEQRRLAEKGKLIMAGRDIGTVVLPYAELKIFLTAPMQERAERRYKELLDKGKEVVFKDILEELEKRDNVDKNRSVSPLKPASDAMLVDTGGRSLQQVVETIYNLVTSR